MEDVNTDSDFHFLLSKLRYGPLKFNSRKFETARFYSSSDFFAAFNVVGYISSQMNI